MYSDSTGGALVNRTVPQLETLETHTAARGTTGSVYLKHWCLVTQHNLLWGTFTVSTWVLSRTPTHRHLGLG